MTLTEVISRAREGWGLANIAGEKPQTPEAEVRACLLACAVRRDSWHGGEVCRVRRWRACARRCWRRARRSGGRAFSFWWRGSNRSAPSRAIPRSPAPRETRPALPPAERRRFSPSTSQCCGERLRRARRRGRYRPTAGVRRAAGRARFPQRLFPFPGRG